MILECMKVIETVSLFHNPMHAYYMFRNYLFLLSHVPIITRSHFLIVMWFSFVDMSFSSAPLAQVRARGTQIRTWHRVRIQEEDVQDADADGDMWQEHMHALWSQMTKQELEEEVNWRSDDQKVSAERVKNLQAELTRKEDELKKKDEEISRSGTDILRQYNVIDRQRAYIDSLHQLLPLVNGPQ